MIFGNPDKFAFLIERMPEWEDSTWINGIMFVLVNGKIYPAEIRTTTFNSELPDLLRDDSAFVHPVENQKLYRKKTAKLFRHLTEMTYSRNFLKDDRFLIPFHELNDAGYNFFVLSDGDRVKILIGKWKSRKIKFVDKTVISLQTYNEIKSQLTVFYNNGK